MIRTAALVLCFLAAAVVAQECTSIGYTTLQRTGLEYKKGVYGQVRDQQEDTVPQFVPANAVALPTDEKLDEQLRKLADASFTNLKVTADVSVNPDGLTLHNVGGNKLYAISHMESPTPSTMYRTELKQDKKTGELSVKDTEAISDEGSNGNWVNCGGSRTPWNTHTGSEEYPPDCRAYEDVLLKCTADAPCVLEGDNTRIPQFARFYGFTQGAQQYGLDEIALFGTTVNGNFLRGNAANIEAFKRQFSCYGYGAIPEVDVKRARIHKWRTLGRYSHETSEVMPDQRTWYTTDDSPNGVLLKFVGAQAGPGSVEAGTLYAAKFSNQVPATAPVGTTSYQWDVSWVELASATAAELDAMATNPSFKFSDIFEVADPITTPPPTPPTNAGCPAGFLRTNTVSPRYLKSRVAGSGSVYIECLKVKPGMEKAAAFLESRRFAAMKEATAEFTKMEGFSVNAKTRKAYMALSTNVDGQVTNIQYDFGVGTGPAGNNDLRLAKTNACGSILELDLDANWSAVKARTLRQGQEIPNDGNGNRCALDEISEPDNVYVVGGNLIIAEDTGRHLNNALWAHNLRTGTLTRIMTAPRGAEFTGPTSVSLRDFSYIGIQMQHPIDDTPLDGTNPASVDEKRGYFGYLGPFPFDIESDSIEVSFTSISVPVDDAGQRSVRATNRACATRV